MAARIFVYGTLRRDAGDRAPPSLKLGWTFEGIGTVPGELYDLGRYPGAIPSKDRSDTRVRGEVYGLPRPADTLRRLDIYEGCGPDDPQPHQFVRELIDVELEDGRCVRAWIYWFGGTPLGRPIQSGDWIQG